jgi:hypothetical protein
MEAVNKPVPYGAHEIVHPFQHGFPFVIVGQIVLQKYQLQFEQQQKNTYDIRELKYFFMKS